MSLVALRTSHGGRVARDTRAFLPTTREEMNARGWDELDILIVTGDAYVDHPAFGPVLVAYGNVWVGRSYLLHRRGDLLVFGRGGRAAGGLQGRLEAGQHIDQLKDIRGTAHVRKNRRGWTDVAAHPSRYVTDGKPVVLPSFEDVSRDKTAFASMSRMFQYETNAHNARPLLQPHGDEAVYFNPPALPLEEAEMDALYDLPFQRRSHPSYGEHIPAFETVKHSIVTMRGCFGACTFCSITE